MYYPLALGAKPSSKRQGPLPSLEVCCTKEKELGKAPVWFFSLPKGPRDENGDLANVAAGDLALVLAFAMAMRIDEMDVVNEQITVGIVISHNNTLWYVQEKLAAVRDRIKKERIQELGVALTGREPTNDTLQRKLQSDDFQIRFHRMSNSYHQ